MCAVEWAFIEDHDFTTDIPRYFGDDATYQKFQLDMLEHPEAGQVIPGTGGFRKVRWADKRRGTGTRGGLRVIYLLVREVSTMALFMVYDKGEQDDLSEDDKKALAQVAKTIKAALLTQRYRTEEPS